MPLCSGNTSQIYAVNRDGKTLGTFDENCPSFAEGSEPEVLTEALSETSTDDPEAFDDEDNFL